MSQAALQYLFCFFFLNLGLLYNVKTWPHQEQAKIVMGLKE